MNTVNINYNTEIFYLENWEPCTILHENKWLALMLEKSSAVLNRQLIQEHDIIQPNIMKKISKSKLSTSTPTTAHEICNSKFSL